VPVRSRFYLAQLRNINGPEVAEEVEALVADELEQLLDAPVLDGRVQLHHPHHGPEPVAAAAACAEQPFRAELAGVSSSPARRRPDTRRHPATAAGAIVISWDDLGTVRPALVMKRRERRKKTRQGRVHGVQVKSQV